MEDLYTISFVRCQSCGKVLGDKEERLNDLINDGVPADTAMWRLGISRICCRMSMMSPIMLPMGRYYQDVSNKEDDYGLVPEVKPVQFYREKKGTTYTRGIRDDTDIFSISENKIQEKIEEKIEPEVIEVKVPKIETPREKVKRSTTVTRISRREEKEEKKEEKKEEEKKEKEKKEEEGSVSFGRTGTSKSDPSENKIKRKVIARTPVSSLQSAVKKNSETEKPSIIFSRKVETTKSKVEYRVPFKRIAKD
jgi:DNA-directed RNA polymerase subunit N (RpoN/RPB10)